MKVEERVDLQQEVEQIRFSLHQKLLVAGGVALIALFFLVQVRGILKPFIWAIIVAYLLDPIVTWLAKHSGLRRVYVVTAIFIAFLGGTIGFLWLIVPVMSDEVREVIKDYPNIIRSLFSNVAGGEPLVIFGQQFDTEAITSVLSGAIRELPKSVPLVLTRTVDSLARMFIFLVATFLLVRDAPRISEGARNLVPTPYRTEVTSLMRRINAVLGNYIRGQLFLIIFMSAMTWIALGPIMHLRFALVMSVTTGFLELFPIIGPIVAGAIACSIALFQSNSFGWPPWVYAAVIAGIYTVLRHMEDYLVIPNVIGRVVHLHPLLIIFALFSGATIAGVLGMFIAVPATAVLKILGEYLVQKLAT